MSANETLIPLSDVSVIAAPSSSDGTYSDPSSILQNKTWLLAENEPGYWSASFSFTFTPTKLRLWNANVNGSGSQDFYLTPQSTVGIANLTYLDPADTNVTASCSRSCPLSLTSSLGYQDFHFVNVISMNAFRLDIAEWYGSAGGLTGIQLYGNSQASSTSTQSTSSSSASSTSALGSTSSASPIPAATTSPQASNVLSGDAIAGIVIGVIASFSIIVASFIFWYRKLRHKRNSEGKPEEKFVPLGGRHEVDANGIYHTKYRGELGGHPVSELENVPLRHELEGSAVPELPNNRLPG